MDMPSGAVILSLLMMVGMIVLAGLVLLGRRLWLRLSGRDGASGEDPWAGSEGSVTPSPTQALWEAWLQTPLTTGTPVAAALPPAGRTRPRRWLVGLVALSVLPLGYISWVQLRPPQRDRTAIETVVLTSIDKWADAVSMFEDKLRIRFHFLNTGDRTVDAFNVFFQLVDAKGDTVIRDNISIDNPVEPGATSSWTQTYWATCEQRFSPDAWIELLRADIGAYEVQWQPTGLIYSDGEGKACYGPTNW